MFKKKGKEKNRSAFISSSYILYTLLEVCVLVRAIEKMRTLEAEWDQMTFISCSRLCSLKGKKYGGNVAPTTRFR